MTFQPQTKLQSFVRMTSLQHKSDFVKKNVNSIRHFSSSSQFGPAQQFLLLAKQGDPKAQLFYGVGLLQEENFAEALHWLEKAAQKNEIEAIYLVGLLYKDGK